MNKLSFVSIVSVLVLASVSAFGQEAPVAAAADAAPAEAVAPVTEQEVDAYLSANANRIRLGAEAGYAVNRARITGVQYNVDDLRAENRQLTLKLKGLESRLDKAEKDIDKLKNADDYTFGTVSAGYLMGMGGGESAPFAKFTFEKFLGLYGEVIPGYGYGVGLNGFNPRIGRVNIHLLGLGVVLYGNDKVMHSPEYSRSWDLAVKPIEVSVGVYRVAGIQIEVGASLRWLLPSPKTAYDAADKSISNIENKTSTGNVNPTLPNVDPSNPQGSLDDLQNQGNSLVQGQAQAQADEVKSKGEQAVTEAGKIYEKVFTQGTQFGFFVGGSF